MLIKALAAAAGNFGGEYDIANSLRFNDDDTARLTRTPSVAGNRRTFTFSAWVKRGNVGAGIVGNLFSVRDTSTTRTVLRINGDSLDWLDDDFNFRLITSAKLRDVGGWYHIVATADTTQATTSDRLKIYINGVRVSSFSTSSYPSQNYETEINNTRIHAIGVEGSTTNDYFDGYLAEINFIDGQALTADDFGRIDATIGEWSPKKYSGTYGTNGFYLPFTPTTQASGFNVVTYTGTGASRLVTGMGFQPDFVWIKGRSDPADYHFLFDVVRGADKVLKTNLTDAEYDGGGTGYFPSFDADGFSLTGNGLVNGATNTYVAWGWEAGGAAVTNTDGSITSQVSANVDTGFSIVEYNGSGSFGSTVGHGLAGAPDLVLIKSSSHVSNWLAYHSATPSGYYYFSTTGVLQSASWFSSNTNTFTLNNIYGDANTSGRTYIAYCFKEIEGFSKISSYVGNGSSDGPEITTGFKPAFVMIKRSDGTSDWTLLDTSRSPNNPVSNRLWANLNLTESTASTTLDVLSDGFKLKTSDAYANASGGTYIYMAFADTRDSDYYFDASGNKNNVIPNNLADSDVMLDTPTNNFAVLNPLDKSAAINLSEGNLKTTLSSPPGVNVIAYGTVGVSSGKWYMETTLNAFSYSGNGAAGIFGMHDGSNRVGAVYSTGSSSWFAFSEGSSTALSFSGSAVGMVMQIAIDLDAGKLWVGKDGVWNGSGDPDTGANPDRTFTPSGTYKMSAEPYRDGTGYWFLTVNAGADSSFAGLKTQQGNTDANGIGDFYYAPPTGYLALCTDNLPEPAIVDSETQFNVVTYTGDGNTGRTVTGVGFQPDFVWLKERNNAAAHFLYDSVRGATIGIHTNLGDPEATYTDGLTSFDSDGFTVGSRSNNNGLGDTYVAWCWKAGGTAVTNTDGAVTSQVSANVNAGFSVATYTGNGSTGTIGHGLSKKPDFVIIKNRTYSPASGWFVGSPSFGTNNYMNLNSTNGMLNYVDGVGGAFFNYGGWSDSVINVYNGDSDSINGISEGYVMYCFHSVDGFSKIGSYVGNGSTDGPFIYTDFRPAFVLYKRATGGTGNWILYDNKREGYNGDNPALYPNLNLEESISGASIDLLSNGFKILNPNTDHNASGSTYIYMAFAEAPFKNALAR